MLFLTTVLLLAAVLHPSLGEEEKEEEEEDGMAVGSLSPKMKKIIVDKHNEIRRKVIPTAANMLKMIWNETVAEQARKLAEQCIFTSSPMANRTLGDMVCGENILQTNNFKEWKNVIKFWTVGMEYFKYGTGATDPDKNIFGYTQMIWYNSYQVGCSVAYCENVAYPFLYICHYCPGGNFISQIPTPYKSGPSCEYCPDNCEDKLCTNPCKYTDSIMNCSSLRRIHSCKRKFIAKGCQATCKCKKEIV